MMDGTDIFCIFIFWFIFQTKKNHTEEELGYGVGSKKH